MTLYTNIIGILNPLSSSIQMSHSDTYKGAQKIRKMRHNDSLVAMLAVAQDRRPWRRAELPGEDTHPPGPPSVNGERLSTVDADGM